MAQLSWDHHLAPLLANLQAAETAYEKDRDGARLTAVVGALNELLWGALSALAKDRDSFVLRGRAGSLQLEFRVSDWTGRGGRIADAARSLNLEDVAHSYLARQAGRYTAKPERHIGRAQYVLSGIAQEARGLLRDAREEQAAREWLLVAGDAEEAQSLRHRARREQLARAARGCPPARLPGDEHRAPEDDRQDDWLSEDDNTALGPGRPGRAAPALDRHAPGAEYDVGVPVNESWRDLVEALWFHLPGACGPTGDWRTLPALSLQHCYAAIRVQSGATLADVARYELGTDPARMSRLSHEWQSFFPDQPSGLVPLGAFAATAVDPAVVRALGVGTERGGRWATMRNPDSPEQALWLQQRKAVLWAAYQFARALVTLDELPAEPVLSLCGPPGGPSDLEVLLEPLCLSQACAAGSRRRVRGSDSFSRCVYGNVCGAVPLHQVQGAAPRTERSPLLVHRAVLVRQVQGLASL